LELQIGAKLRSEKRFASVTELRSQIGRDVAAIREME
jgi:FAD synthase